MTYPAKIKRKRTCNYCATLFYRKDSFSDAQWQATKFCSRQCSASSKRKHKDNKAKGEAWRRRQGMLVQGTDDWRALISETTKLAMARPEVREKIRQPRSAMTLEVRMKHSIPLRGKMPKNMMYHNNYPNVKSGWYDINGTTMYFRSKWEANYALYLDFLTDHQKIVKWEYEPDTFIFEAIQLGTRSYTPDFKVFNNDGSFEYHEVKGYMDSKSKTKLKRMKKYYPEITLTLIDSDYYYELRKQVSKICKFY